MRRLLSGMVLLSVIALIPVQATAQRRAAAGGSVHEFGVDVGLGWYKPSGSSGGVQFGTPLDVRVGFVPARGKLMFEPRLALLFDSEGGVAGGSAYTLAPSVDVLYPMGRRSNHRSGMYLTGGVGLLIVDLGPVNGTSFALGGGIGWRKPTGNAALRYELGFRYDTKSDVHASTVNIGGRLGLSLWH